MLLLEPGDLRALGEQIEEEQGEGQPVHEEGEGDRRRDGRGLRAEDGGGLMKGAPPLHGEVDDGNVGSAENAYHGSGARAAIGLVDHAAEQEVAEVNEEEH